MDKGKISIVVPIYMVEDYLERCIRSLLNQTYRNIEIVLVDDGSPDGCPVICDEYARTDSRIKVIHIAHQGVSAARNAGIIAATGKYIMQVDPDDYIEDDSCEKLISYMEDDVDIIAGAIRQVDGDKIKYLRHTNLINGRKYESREFVTRSIMNDEWYASVALNLVRKDFLMENSLLFKVGYFYEDFEMQPRLFLAARTVVYVDYPFYNYCVRPGSTMTAGYTEEKKRMYIEDCEDWMSVISTVDDPEYRRILYGTLVKLYLVSARKMKIKGWKVKGMDYSFAISNAFNARERMKVFLFNCFPVFYRRIAGLVRGER